MARHEPQVTSKYVDCSIATVVNLDSDFVIVSFAATKTGPLGMQVCNGTADFVSKFMTTDKVIASDHTSVLHTYKLLESTPCVVFRVDTCEILTGLDDTGKLLYFDKSKEIIKQLTKIELTANDKIKVMYLTDGEFCYYAGDESYIPEDVEGTRVEVADTDADIQQLVKNLDVKTIDDGEPVFIGNKEWISKKDFGDITSYVSSECVKETLKSYFKRIRTTGTELTGLAEGDYITLEGYDYILRYTGISDAVYNNTPVYVDFNTNLNVNQYVFLSKVLDSMLTQGQGGLISACTWRPVFTIKGSNEDHWEYGSYTEDLFKGVYVTTDDEEGSVTFSYNSNPDLKRYSNQYLVLTNNESNYLFYVGSDPSSSMEMEFTKKYNLGVNAVSIYGFLADMWATLSVDSLFADYTFSFKFADDIADLMFAQENDTSVGVHISNADNIVYIYQDEKTDVLYRYTFPSQETVQNELIHDSLYVKLDDYTFYTGTYNPTSVTETPVRLGAKCSVFDFLTLLNNQVSMYFEAALTKNGEILISGDVEVECGPQDESGESTLITYEKDLISQNPQSKFAIIQNFSSWTALFSFSYSKQLDYNEAVYDINLAYKDWNQDYEMTFDPTVNNQAGQGIYYPLINNSQDYVTVKLLNADADTEDEFESRMFGNDVHGSDPTENDFVATAQQMTELDNFYPNVLFDGGIMSPTFYKSLATLAYQPDTPGSLNAQVFIGVPEDACKTYDKLIQWKNSVGLTDPHCHYLQPTFWDTCGDFSAVFGAHLYYIKKLVTNYRSIVNEFQPPFGYENGVISPGYLMTTELGKSDRVKLLEQSVNSIVRRVSDGTFYVNQNYTAQLYESDLSEEQIMRLVLIMNQVVDKYMWSTIANYNTNDLRAKVVRNLNSLIDERFIQNHNGGLLQYRVICDETNNTAEVIAARKIRVSVIGLYQRSIDWVQITNKVYDLANEDEFNSVSE